jgi:mannosyltransferase
MNDEIDIEELAPWLAVVVTLIGGGLRVLLLGTKSMWLDETFSVWMASQPIGDMLQWIVKIDQHPPLYYLLLHFWIALNGDGPYDVRMFSVLFGTGTIPIIYLIGQRMSGATVGLAAAAILALSPFHIYYAQETRMYTLLAFNAAVAIYALVRLLTGSRAARDWVLFVVFSVATMLTHNTALLFPLATNLFVLGLMLFQKLTKSGSPLAFQPPSFRNWVTAQVAILLLWSPWIVTFIRQAGAVDQRFWIPAPTWDSVVRVLGLFLNTSTTYLEGNQAIGVWGIYLLLLCLGLMYYRNKLPQFLFLAALFAVPFLGELIVSIRRPIFLDRTLLWITIPLFLVLAAGIVQLRFRFLIIAFVGIVSAVSLFSAGDYYRFFQKEDWQTAAGYVALYAEEDDLVLFNSNFVVIAFDYYFRAYEDLYDIQIEKQGVPQDLFNHRVLEPEMTENDIPELRSRLRGHDRVWLVYSHDVYTDPDGLIPQTLASEMKLIKNRDFYGGRVQLYGLE